MEMQHRIALARLTASSRKGDSAAALTASDARCIRDCPGPIWKTCTIAWVAYLSQQCLFQFSLSLAVSDIALQQFYGLLLSLGSHVQSEHPRYHACACNVDQQATDHTPSAPLPTCAIRRPCSLYVEPSACTASKPAVCTSAISPQAGFSERKALVHRSQVWQQRLQSRMSCRAQRYDLHVCQGFRKSQTEKALSTREQI